MVKLISKFNVFNEGSVEMYDFSGANSSQVEREEAVALIGSVNYGKTIANPVKFYNKMLTESEGRASEVLSFLPVIFQKAEEEFSENFHNRAGRFSYMEKGNFYTNLRTLVNCSEGLPDNFYLEKDDGRNFIVFRLKIPQFVLMHFYRHEMLSRSMAKNEQSNRRKHPIEFFENDEVRIKSITSEIDVMTHDFDVAYIPELINGSKRKELINKGEFGLRYTNIWLGGWANDPATFANMFRVRSGRSTQREAREVTKIMKLMMKHYEIVL